MEALLNLGVDLDQQDSLDMDQQPPKAVITQTCEETGAQTTVWPPQASLEVSTDTLSPDRLQQVQAAHGLDPESASFSPSEER